MMEANRPSPSSQMWGQPAVAVRRVHFIARCDQSGCIFRAALSLTYIDGIGRPQKIVILCNGHTRERLAADRTLQLEVLDDR